MKHASTVNVLFAVFLLLLRPGSTVAQDATLAGRFVQDTFAIGLWVPPQTSGVPADRHREIADRYRECADANFTVVIGTSGITAHEQLELCQRLGLKAIVDADGPADRLPDGPACWGYKIVDEPGAGVFADLAKRADEIRKVRPGRFGYINLFPNYAPLWALGTSSYDEHVARFVREVKPEVLSMDHYPLMRPEADTRDHYCENLETMRKYSLQARIPFWNYFYCMPFNDRLDPTEAQIRWQINTSLAYGARGVLYFCYWTPGKGAAGGGEFPKGGAIITAEGLKTRHYDEARRINAELKNLGPTLMKLISTGVYRVNTRDKTPATRPHSPIRSIARVGSDPDNEYIIGTFDHADGRRAALIVNHSYSYTAWVTVEFDASPNDTAEVSKTTGQAIGVVDDSPELKGVQLSLGPGDARLFLLPAEETADGTGSAAPLPAGVRVVRELEYVKDGHERNRLDIYLPEKAAHPLPVIVWVHGGGWQGGNKAGCPKAAIQFAAEGYAVAAINYRLSQHAVFPAQIHDCKAAIRWLRANAQNYSLDPGRIGVWGGSAGGLLVGLLGTTAGVKDLEGPGGNQDQSSRVQAVVDWFGPSDMYTVGPKDTRTRFLGCDPQNNKDKAAAASPITYVSEDAAPFLVMHGDEDTVVPMSQSETFAQELKRAGVEVTFITVRGAGHGGRLFSNDENMRTIREFFGRHLLNTQSATKPE